MLNKIIATTVFEAVILYGIAEFCADSDFKSVSEPVKTTYPIAG